MRFHLSIRQDLWSKYRAWKGLSSDDEAIVLQDYFDDGSGKAFRYDQTNAINATIRSTNPHLLSGFGLLTPGCRMCRIRTYLGPSLLRTSIACQKSGGGFE
jgi:hypothetical protein